MRPTRLNSDLTLGVICVVFAIVAIFLWIPNDSGSGIVEKVRGRLSIGDALAPTVAATILLLSAAALCIESRFKKAVHTFNHESFRFLGYLFLTIFFSIALMTWTGTFALAVANLFTGESRFAEYRLLRDTVPWKYFGFLVGGTFLITALISIIENRRTFKALAIGICVTTVLMLLYDLPFEDLLLPPNGDF